MRHLDIHADDYGLSAGASEDILKCIGRKRLRSEEHTSELQSQR